MRARCGEARITVRDITAAGGGLVADVLAIGTGTATASGWRFTVAVRVQQGLIGEIRPFADRQAALDLVHAS